MFGNWKKKMMLLLLGGVLYAVLSTPGLLKIEQIFRENNSSHPLTPRMCYLTANLAYWTLRYELAAEMYDKNIREFPYFSGRKDAEFRRARAYEKSGDYSRAIALYEDFLLEYPKDRRHDSVESAIAVCRISAQGI